MSRLVWRVFFACASLAASEQAHAQMAQDAPATPRSTTNTTVDLDTISVTATKTEEKVIDALGGVSTVTPVELHRIQPGRFSEVLTDVPGVTTQDSPNDPGQAINIRGLQDFGRVNVLIDGARQDYQISGHNANGTFYLDPEFVGGIDIVRGPISNIYGSGAIGGVAAFRTRGVDDVLKPDENYGAVERVGYGSNGAGFVDSISGAVRMGTAADVFGQFVTRTTTSYHDGNGNLVQDTGSALNGGLAKINLRPAEGQAISGTALIQNYVFDNYGTANSGPRWHNDVTTQSFTFGYTFQRPDISWLDFSLKTYYQNTEMRQNALSVDDATYAALGVIPGDMLSDKIDTYGFDVHNTARFSTLVFDHALTVGGDGVWDVVHTTDHAGGYISALTPGGQRSLTGAFVQDEMRYGSWLRLLGALRFDQYSLNGGDASSSGTHLSPKLTLGITPIRGIEVYGTYASGYRAPSITETLVDGTHPFPAFNILPNPNLRPEVARDLEAGVNLQYDNILRDGDAFRAKIDGFVNRIDNYIDFTTVGNASLVPFIPGMPTGTCAYAPYLCFPINSYQYLNIAEAQISGIEIEGTYDWRDGFLTIAGTHLNGKNVTSPSIPLATLPPDRISGTLGLRFLHERLTVGTRLTLVDKSQNISGEIFAPTNAYALVDLFATYKYDDNISADFTIKNLLNKDYTQYLNTEANPGLTIKAALSVKFASR